ncbi:MAG TPA: gamma-glutamyltransferase [Longimicrobiales bacterium]|nr:gamma-glutamyltransferase [Longimicrobiales bacterium]
MRWMSRTDPAMAAVAALALVLALAPAHVHAQRTMKPVLHGSEWIAITGKPLAATAGAMIFQQGGNAVDAAAAMIAATSTMWDVLSWGGETQALIYDPHARRVIGINALGVAPTGATPELYRSRGHERVPEFGPLAAVTPGTPGGIIVMVAEYGKLSLAQVLAPAIRMADGYPIEEQTANSIERNRDRLKEWRYSAAVMLPHAGSEREAPRAGEVFRQPDLAATLRKLVEAERDAIARGAGRRDAIYAAFDRFYKGDIADEIARSVQEQGGLITKQDLADWRVAIEEPVSTNYRGVEVYKLTHWTQGPALLQALNILETMDLKSMGYNSARYIHALYQAMNLAFADRDFYYGDPNQEHQTPIRGLLSRAYARDRAATIGWERNDPDVRPGDPYPHQGGTNPFTTGLESWRTVRPEAEKGSDVSSTAAWTADDPFHLGTTTVQAADAEGWVVSVTPSGGWIPAVIAGRTGIGLSQRAQSFVMDPADNPYNVLTPGRQPRVTLTPTLALKDGEPFLSFAVQGGDSQDQNLLQFLLNVVEFGMNVQQAAEAANINSYQMRSSFGDQKSEPGRLLVHELTPPWVVAELRRMGYRVETGAITSGPINAIFFDRRHGTFWGGSSHHGEDYGIAW